MAERQFGKGSMEPKIMAVLNYLEHGGKRVLNPNPENMLCAINGETGTQILA
jgi:carbamate kinase